MRNRKDEKEFQPKHRAEFRCMGRATKWNVHDPDRPSYSANRFTAAA
jgi:hypothetical protein